MRQTTWGGIGLHTVSVAFLSSCSLGRPTVQGRAPHLSQSSLLRLPCKIPPVWTLWETARCNLVPDIHSCSWAQRHYCQPLFELEKQMKESGTLTCQRGKKVDCNLGWEKLVWNKHSFKHLRSFHAHAAGEGPLYLPVYLTTTDTDPFLNS